MKETLLELYLIQVDQNYRAKVNASRSNLETEKLMREKRELIVKFEELLHRL